MRMYYGLTYGKCAKYLHVFESYGKSGDINLRTTH